MSRISRIITLLILITLIFSRVKMVDSRVKLGLEVLLDERFSLIKGKRIGLVTNQTGVDSCLRSNIDILYRFPGIRLTTLFAPEHGIRGERLAGEYVKSYTDEKTGLPVYSLYGETRKPTKEMLKNVDVLIFDIQDVGVRHYTYISTMALAMQSAKENNIEFIVLDRPNPLGGIYVDGPVLEPEFSSFIGLYPIPNIYGMTIGELALMFNSEFKISSKLTVVPMNGWRRDMKFNQTGLYWVMSSPNIPDFETVMLYPCTGPIGDTYLSVGVGTTKPFHFVGAPYIDPDRLIVELLRRKIEGVFFRSAYFIPRYSKFQNKLCKGVEIYIIDKDKFKPLELCINILDIIYRLYPKDFNWGDKSGERYIFDLSMGTDKVRRYIESGIEPKEIIKVWKKDMEKFLIIRNKYLIYK
ncbi:MAG: exo-beta-N-acetylmuramidase NamZ family protein [bacterium]